VKGSWGRGLLIFLVTPLRGVMPLRPLRGLPGGSSWLLGTSRLAERLAAERPQTRHTAERM